MQRCYVYIMASKSRVLYTGVTNDVWRRTWEHKNDVMSGFCRDYRVHRLVYFESFRSVASAIRREKQIKGWLRKRKTALIESVNPTWEDQGAQWFDGKQVIKFDLAAAQQR